MISWRFSAGGLFCLGFCLTCERPQHFFDHYCAAYSAPALLFDRRHRIIINFQ